MFFLQISLGFPEKIAIKMNKTFGKWLILSLSLVLTTIFLHSILNIKELTYNTLAERLTSKQINRFLDFQEKWHWIGYVFVPLIILIKTSLIASILHIGIFFFGKSTITHEQLWNIVINAEFIFLLVPFSKIVWFYFFYTNYKLEDIQNFYPLSALNIIGYDDLKPWFIYPFQILNLFELSYWLILAYYIGKNTQTNTDRGLKIVAYSYGSALLLWVVTIMFFALNYL